MDKRLLVPITMLIVVLGAGAVYAVASFNNQVIVTVKEPLQVSPSTTNLSTWAGASSSYTVSACNSANFNIPITFQAQVTAVPPNGGNALDLTLTVTQLNGLPLPTQIIVPQAQLDGTASCYQILVSYQVTPAAVAGPYTISNTASKIF